MTDKPTHRPMSRADWDAMNEHARRVLHPESDAKIAAIRKEVDEAYSDAVSIRFNIADVRALLNALDAAQAELRTARERIAALEDARDAMRRAAEDYAAKWRNELLGNVQDSIDLPEQPYEAAPANRLLAERATELGWLPSPAELSAPKVVLTKAQHRILTALAKGPRRESESVFIFRGNTNALIGLEKRRWITRDYDTGVVRITPAGRTALAAVQAKDGAK